ncbi:MAG: hypothetical protein EXS55_02640, partial [Candidatus Magasanikbacteria bacterium]|nr:hypothetical protein [Candidatus Magasanikbacteria bacterium]
LSFKRHDLIDSKAEAAKEYDIVICNNVLQHFPEHTRELILVNILENLQDRGTLALETDHLFFNSEEEEKWLAPYYKWKKHLKKFGLKQATIKNSRTLWGSNVVFRYEKNRNKFKDGTYRIRNEKLEKKR